MAGDYVVGVVPGAETPLSSTGADATDGADNNDNGIQAAAGDEVLSNVITLAPNTEAENEPGQGGSQDATNDNDGDMTVDFGFVPYVSVGSTVFGDADNNGVFDEATEEGIEGITVSLYEDADMDGTPDAVTAAASDAIVLPTSPGTAGLRQVRLQHLASAGFTPTAKAVDSLNRPAANHSRQLRQHLQRCSSAMAALAHVAPQRDDVDSQLASMRKQAFAPNTQAAHNYLCGVGKQPIDIASKALVTAAVLDAQNAGFRKFCASASGGAGGPRAYTGVNVIIGFDETFTRELYREKVEVRQGQPDGNPDGQDGAASDRDAPARVDRRGCFLPVQLVAPDDGPAHLRPRVRLDRPQIRLVHSMVSTCVVQRFDNICHKHQDMMGGPNRQEEFSLPVRQVPSVSGVSLMASILHTMESFVFDGCTIREWVQSLQEEHPMLVLLFLVMADSASGNLWGIEYLRVLLLHETDFRGLVLVYYNRCGLHQLARNAMMLINRYDMVNPLFSVSKILKSFKIQKALAASIDVTIDTHLHWVPHTDPPVREQTSAAFRSDLVDLLSATFCGEDDPNFHDLDRHPLAAGRCTFATAAMMTGLQR